MKKIISITLTLLLVLGALAGCGNDEDKKVATTSQETTNKETLSSEVAIENETSVDEMSDVAEQETTELVESEASSEEVTSKLEESSSQQESHTNKETKPQETTKKKQETTTKKKTETTSKKPETTTKKPETKPQETTTEEETTTEYIEPHLNRTEIVYYRGGAVDSGIKYVDYPYTDYTQEFIELYVYGVDRKDVKWSSANTDIAQVEDGKVVVYNKGKTVISAEVNGKVFKCNLDVRVICPYFYIDYSYVVDDNLLSYYGRKDHWIWYDWFQMNVGDTVKYKVTEREYNEKGELIKETDITKKIDLKPAVDNVFKVDKNNGTITALKETDWTKGEKLLTCVLATSDCFRYEYNEAGNNKPIQDIYFVQRLNLVIDSYEKGTFDDELEITMEGEWGTKFFALEDFDCVGMFTWDDEFIEDTTWYYYSTGLNEFTWTSSNTSVIKIGEPMGSGHELFGAVRYEILAPGTTTITVKRGDKFVDSIEVVVDNNLKWKVVE